MNKQLTILFYLTSLLLSLKDDPCYPNKDSIIKEFEEIKFQQSPNLQKPTSYITW